ncbi:hypothetical protein [Parahaliea mediterranea]|uniref:hypothetical protein n=1 Tax=Parahaliea mediterranea TaxID=651086 RepID=UPI001300331D|nr:hypothetical protein [Parahaliea mediterranea]
MLARSLVAVLLSLPATVALIGLFLALVPASNALALPALLMAFVLWVALASASYLIPRALPAALVLLAITGISFALLTLLKLAGVSAV